MTTKKNMTQDEAVAEIGERLKYKLWQDRAAQMLRALCRSNTTPTTVSDLTVHPTWPSSGAIWFTRDADGARFRLMLKGERFVGERM